jgi:hypothetical protein
MKRRAFSEHDRNSEGLCTRGEKTMHCLIKNRFAIAIFVAAVMGLAAVAGISAYKTHKENDSGLFLSAYPNLAGTRMDGCDACHNRISALPPGAAKGKSVILSSCDSCHRTTDYGRKTGDTLTAFGRHYLNAGRNAAAFKAIAALDSDGDGDVNAAELKAGTNPGDPASKPGKKSAPQVTLSLRELIHKGVPSFVQTIFVNVAKSKDGDSYSDLRGFKLIDVLKAAGLTEKAISIDVISLDGYMTTFSIEQLRRPYHQAPPVMGLDTDALGECGWVRYGAKNLKEGVSLPDANILLSYEVNGEPYPPASINSENRLMGSGPFRIVAPQMKNPGIPDLSSKATDACVEKMPAKFHYNRNYEKNSDYCVKAVEAIRVNPMPAGTMDIDWPRQAAGANDQKSIVIFGALEPKRP